LRRAKRLFYSAYVSDAPSSAKVPLLAAIAIVIGNMVGTGVFVTLGFQVGTIQSGFLLLLPWLIGGLLAFFGAVNYAELAAAFPRSGGEYQLLSRIYHPGIGFVSGWISLIVGFPAPVALAALVFGNYICDVTGADPQWYSRPIAAGLVLAITAAHLVSVAFSGRFQSISTALKVMLVAALAVCGFMVAHSQPVQFLPQPGDGALMAGKANALFSDLVWVTFAYSGWNAACYIAGEVERPERNVPRALLLGTAAVTLLYVGVNAAMLYSTPISELGEAKARMASVAATHIFGDSGGKIMAGLIAAGLISSISAMVWAGSRVSQQMGNDYQMLRFLARTNASGVPWLSVLFQGILALMLIFTSDVDDIVNRTTFLLQIVLLLTVWGVVHLRIRQPDLLRPCRAWGYPWTTVIFLIMVAFTMASQLRTSPDDTKWGMAILIIGIAFYLAAKPPKKA
jgi:APA family basic amino acid/polyamine antiporter